MERLLAFALRFAAAAVIVLLAAVGCNRRESFDGTPSPATEQAGSPEASDLAAVSTAEEDSNPGLTGQPADTTGLEAPGGPPDEAAAAEESLPAGGVEAEKPVVDALAKLGAQLERNDRGQVYRLEAVGLKISVSEAQRLADLPALESLEIGDTLLDGDTLKHLSGLVGLKRLYLRKVGLTDDALENLKGLSQIEVLSLACNQISGVGLVHLRGLERLEVLNLSTNPLMDDGLVHLANFKQLNTLTLADTGVTGTGLAHLKPLDKLRVLNLDRTDVVDGDLGQFTGFTNMRMLYLRGCKVSEESVSQLDDAVSGLSVYY